MDVDREKEASLAKSYTAGEAVHSLTCTSFPPHETSQAEKDSLGTSYAALVGGVMCIKSNCSSYLLQCVQTCLFLLQRHAGASLLETCTSTKALSSMGDCLRHCSPGASGPWPR